MQFLSSSLRAKLLFALFVAGLMILLFLTLWFTPQSRDRFRERSAALIEESSGAMRETAAKDVEDSRDILVRLIRHTTDARARSLEDIPIAIYGGDLERFRIAIRDEDAERKARLERNVRILSREMNRRALDRIDTRVQALADKQLDESEEFARDVRRSSLVLFAVALGALLVVLGFALYRQVVRPIRRLRQMTQRVAGGDLSLDEGAIARGSRDEIGQLSRDFSVMVDQLRASQRAQAEKLASLETLAGGVAHEFNNLIGGIRGTAGEALSEDADEELRRESLSVIRRAADRGAKITDQLRRFSRANRAVRREIDIVRVLRDALQLLHADAQARGVVIEVDAPESLQLEVDGDGMHQVFLNLLRNALQAMPKGGTIRVRAQRQGEMFVLSIEDEGVGIPADVVGRIFDPFFTTKLDAVDAFERGSGLGLSVSHSVVLAHDGRMTVDSEPGRGTTFRVTLPSPLP